MVGNYIGSPGTVGDGRGRRKTSENIGRRRGRWGTVGDDTMSSVLVLGSYLSGKSRKRRDGTTKFRPSSSWPRTDGLPPCEHCFSLVSPEIRHFERAYRGYHRRLSSLSLWRSETVEFATSKLNISYVQISWVASYFSFGL